MKPSAVVVVLCLVAATASALEPGDPAPRLTPEDVKGRTLVVPAPGRVMLLSFSSQSTAEATGEISRAVRVQHPELEILSFIDVSSFPGFARSIVKGRIAGRHDGAVKATRAAFVEAGKTAPDDLDARIHIIPDYDATSCKAYGAGSAEEQPALVVVGADGRVEAIFRKTLSLAAVLAAVAKETGDATPR